MTIRAIVAWARAIPGCLGVAVYTDDARIFNEGLEPEYASVLRGLLLASPDVVRFSAVVRGVTFIAFKSDDLIVLLKVAGRFPALPGLRPDEPEFVDPAGPPALPAREAARKEAGALLRQLGLL